MTLSILDNGLEIVDGQLRFAWFHLDSSGGPGGRRYRCLAFRELASVPYDVSKDTDTLGRQWAALRGIYNAGVDYLYSALGIFHPDHIGIVQLYGAAGEGESRETAASLALDGLAAVQAALANFPQSQTRPPDLRWVEWYLDFVSKRADNILALLGHPDPRASRRGLNSEAALPDYAQDDLAEEQNELLFRGLAKLQKDFVFQITANHVNRRELSTALVQVARVASAFASRRRGSASIGFSIGVPLMAALGRAVSGGTSGSHAVAASTADGVSQSEGVSHGTSHTTGTSETWSTGGSETHTVGTSWAHSTGSSSSWGHSDGTSDSWSHTDSHTSTDSSSTSTSTGSGSSWMTGGATSFGQSHGITNSTGISSTDTSGTGSSHGVSSSEGFSHSGSMSTSGSGGIGAVGQSLGWGNSVSESYGWTGSNGTVDSTSTSLSHSDGVSSGHAESSGVTQGVSSTWSQGASSFSSTSHTSGHAESVGSSDSRGGSTSSADSIGGSTSSTDTVGGSESWSTSRSWAHSTGVSEAWGTTDTTSQQTGRSHVEGQSAASGVAQTAASGFNAGFSTGLVPGISLGRSWQLEDDLADRLTEIMRQFEGLVNQAAAEGGFMTDALLMVEGAAAARAAETLASQAFHGVSVPTPVVTVPANAPEIRAHALANLPYEEFDPADPFGGILWTRYGTLLTAGQLAAYTAPGLVEESTAVVTIAPTPKGLAFYPDMAGDVVLGHQYSPLTRELTRAQVRLDDARLFHTMFAADTGYGKSVAAMRMAYETTLRWQLRTVVLDFGAGWRSLLNAPGLEGHVDIRQLWPTAARPLRWNPLQIGRNINPETQWRAFADIFGSVARLGVKRQKQELLDALRTVYLRAGVLVDDKDVRSDPVLGKVQPEEAEVAEPGTLLSELSLVNRQKLAVLRSSKVDLRTLYDAITARLERVNPRDTMLTGVLEGILYRMNALVQGAAAAQFSAGPDCVPMEDLAKPWGVAIIEGGMFLDDFGKAFLLGWTGWHLYTDMVARRVHEVNTQEPMLQIFFEEANKIFGGAEGGGSEDESGGVSLSQRFGDMFRDARKYKARLHVITQAPSLIPQDIISSCNNLVVGFLKNPKDKDIVLSGIARSEKGFVDEPWRRFLADLQIGMFLGRFPYAFQREMQQPFLFRPLPVVAPEPSDDEIAAKLGRIVI